MDNDAHLFIRPTDDQLHEARVAALVASGLPLSKIGKILGHASGWAVTLYAGRRGWLGTDRLLSVHKIRHERRVASTPEQARSDRRRSQYSLDTEIQRFLLQSEFNIRTVMTAAELGCPESKAALAPHPDMTIPSGIFAMSLDKMAGRDFDPADARVDDCTLMLAVAQLENKALRELVSILKAARETSAPQQ